MGRLGKRGNIAGRCLDPGLCGVGFEMRSATRFQGLIKLGLTSPAPNHLKMKINTLGVSKKNRPNIMIWSSNVLYGAFADTHRMLCTNIGNSTKWVYNGTSAMTTDYPNLKYSMQYAGTDDKCIHSKYHCRDKPLYASKLDISACMFCKLDPMNVQSGIYSHVHNMGSSKYQLMQPWTWS